MSVIWDDADFRARFSVAVGAMVAQCRAELSDMVFSEQPVPVVIPVVSPFAGDEQKQTVVGMVYELLTKLILEATAKDPAEPSTAEVADAETIAAMRLFSIQPWREDERA